MKLCIDLSRIELALLTEAALHSIPRYGAEAAELGAKLQRIAESMADEPELEPAPAVAAVSLGREAVRQASAAARRDTELARAERARKREIEQRREAARNKVAARAAQCRRAA